MVYISLTRVYLPGSTTNLCSHCGTGVGLCHALHGDGQDSPKARGESWKEKNLRWWRNDHVECLALCNMEPKKASSLPPSSSSEKNLCLQAVNKQLINRWRSEFSFVCRRQYSLSLYFEGGVARAESWFCELAIFSVAWWCSWKPWVGTWAEQR